MYCIIVGGGRVGTNLASYLADEGNDVVIIEKSFEISNALKANTAFFVISGDGTETVTLESAGAAKADVLFAVTGDDNTNLVASQVGEYQFAIPNIVLGVNNPRNVKVFRELGIKKVVDRTSDAVQKMIDSMNDIRASAVVGDGFCRVMEFEVEKDSYADGTNIGKLYLPENSTVGALLRGGKILDTDMNTVLRAGDTVVVITALEEAGRIWKIFSKEVE
ncbi:MAG: TrkA family potassium uptake protein [Thermoplasmata archaeon]|nr:TrkA family potassium uptake protein [Thermoplasmata archaeon]